MTLRFRDLSRSSGEADAGCHWKDLVNTRVKERPTNFKEAVTSTPQLDRKQRELQIVREIVAATEDRHEQCKLWQARTGKSEQTLYRRIAELKRGDGFSFENRES